MGTSLTGNNISASYLGLLKSTDSLAIGGTKKTITDGAGNNLPFGISTSSFTFNGGAVDVPTLSIGSINDGFYQPADETIGVTVNGTEVARFLSTGLSLTSSKLTLNNDQKIRWTSDDVYIQGTTSADNIQLGVGGATQFTFAQTTGMRLHQYGSGNITGTVTQRLGVTSTGQVVEIPIGAGALDGSGTAGKLAKFTDSDTLGDSILSESSTVITNTGVFRTSTGTAGSPAYSFTDATNAGIFIDGGAVKLGNGGVVGLSIDGNSDVLINDKLTVGTTSPTAKLTIEDTGADMIDMTRSSVGTYRLAISGSDAFSIFDVGASADRFIIDSSGNSTFAGSITSTSGTLLLTNGSNTRGLSTNGSGHLQISNAANSAGVLFLTDNSLTLGSAAGTGSHSLFAGTAIFTGDVTISNGKFLKLVRNSGSLATDAIGITSGTDDVRLLTTGDFNFVNGSLTNLLTIKNNGSIGINATAPDSPLDIRKNDSATTPILTLRQLGAGDSSINFQTTTSPFGFNIGVDGSDSDAFKIAVGLGDVGTDTALKIDTSKNSTFAGIVESAKIFIAKGQNVSHGASQLRVSQESTSLSELRFYGADASTVGSLRFIGSSSDGSAGGERARIDASGNFLLGTQSAGANLHVSGSGDRSIAIQSGTSGSSILNLGDSGDIDIGSIIYDNSDNSMRFATNAGERLRINSSGNVGFGTTTLTSITSNVSSLSLGGTNANVSGGIAYQANGTAKAFHYVENNNLAHQASTGVGQLFLTNNATALTIDTSQNVGIATTSPTQKLEVGGNIAIHNSSNAPFIDFVESGATSDSKARITMDQVDTNNGTLIFSTEGSGTLTERARITSDGRSFFNYSNENISTFGSGAYGGTVVVKAPSGSSQGLAILNESIGGTSEVALNFTNEFVANQYNYLGRIVAIPESSWSSTASTRSSALSFQTNNAGTVSEKARITSDGKVGIGTSAPPHQKLTVTGSSGAPDGNLTAGILSLTTGTGVIADTRLLFGIVDDDYAWIQAADYGVAYRDLILSPNGGNVGVGTVTPRNDSNTVTLQIGSTSSGASQLVLEDNDTNGPWRIVSNQSLIFLDDTAERLRITSGGNFLVNCTALPDSTVEGFVITGNSSGNRSSSGSATTSYNHLLFYNGNGIVGSISTGGSTTTYSTTSDYRLKEDLKDFNALEIASKIKMYDFKWKADDSRSYGVMAHELQEVVPQAVSGDKDAEDMQQVDYSKLVPILLKSIQELEARVKELEKEI